MQKLLRLFVLTFVLLATVQLVEAQGDGEIFVLNFDGAISQATVNYFERGITTAEAASATAVVINLDTPGGGVAQTLEIVQLFRNSSIPVIVHVTPEGAQAASAGSVITAAAHVAAMSPATVIGAASPINGDGSDINETAYRKAVEDLKATMRSLTERRGEDAVAIAEAMIEEARAVTADEALELGFIDLIADDTEALLQDVDGLTIEIDDEPLTLATADKATQLLELNLTEQILAALTNSLLLGILLTIGAQALIYEITNPGFGVAGIVGLICIALALYGVGQLPVNYLGFGLIGLAFILLISEIFTPTFGILGIGGAIALFAGLLVLFNSPSSPDFVQISIPGAIAITLFTTGFFVFIIAAALRIQRAKPITGIDGLIGQIGPVRKGLTAVSEDKASYQGTVHVNGELWQAESAEPLAPGEKIVVKSVQGFTLHVQKVR
ncbi:MAG: nodulation protein NfeD [Chloroflexota bacterium]